VRGLSCAAMDWAFSKVPPLCLSALDQAPHIDSVHRLFGDLTRAKVKVMNEITARLRSSTRASLQKNQNLYERSTNSIRLRGGWPGELCRGR
jgi:hypothetical protein